MSVVIDAVYTVAHVSTCTSATFQFQADQRCVAVSLLSQKLHTCTSIRYKVKQLLRLKSLASYTLQLLREGGDDEVVYHDRLSVADLGR